MPEPTALRYLAGVPQEPAKLADSTLVMIDLQNGGPMPTRRGWRRRHPARADQELSEQPAARPRDDPKRRGVAGPGQDRVGHIVTELLAALGDDLTGLDERVRGHTRASWHRDQRAQLWVDQLVEAQAERDRLYAGGHAGRIPRRPVSLSRM